MRFTPRSRRHVCALALVVLLTAAACTGGDGSTSPTTISPPATETFPPETLPPIDDAPAAPVGLTVVNTNDGAIELSWSRSRSDEVSGYVLTRVGIAGTTERFDVAGTSFVDDGLDDGTIFTYALAAVGPGGTSERGESVSAQVGVDSNPPNAPGRPRVIDSGEATVVLEWRESTDISGVAEYVVTRQVEADVTEIVVVEPRLVDDVDAGLVATYSVRAVDGVGIEGRRVTLLAGTAADKIVIVVSKQANPSDDPNTSRLRTMLLADGYTVTWFEDDNFDSNITSAEDLVVLLGDVEGEGFDWNIFATDSTVVGLKSMFVQASGITENPPKLDRLAQFDYLPAGGEEREVVLTSTGRPKPVVYDQSRSCTSPMSSSSPNSKYGVARCGQTRLPLPDSFGRAANSPTNAPPRDVGHSFPATPNRWRSSATKVGTSSSTSSARSTNAASQESSRPFAAGRRLLLCRVVRFRCRTWVTAHKTGSHRCSCTRRLRPVWLRDGGPSRRTRAQRCRCLPDVRRR